MKPITKKEAEEYIFPLIDRLKEVVPHFGDVEFALAGNSLISVIRYKYEPDKLMEELDNLTELELTICKKMELFELITKCKDFLHSKCE